VFAHNDFPDISDDLPGSVPALLLGTGGGAGAETKGGQAAQ